MTGEAVIYHFTKKENLQSIFREGLICNSKFLSLGSKLRNNAVYFWLSPANEDYYVNNRDVYNINIVNQITSLKLLQKVAIHDDSTGLLTTYKINDSNDFVTIEEILERDFIR